MQHLLYDVCTVTTPLLSAYTLINEDRSYEIGHPLDDAVSATACVRAMDDVGWIPGLWEDFVSVQVEHLDTEVLIPPPVNQYRA